MANRSYTPLTIKTLFGQASTCAYPGCGNPLIFEDRGAKTVTAEIAHIRSEKIGGPRHDPTFTDAIDGPGNLLLLCGVHHKPVDRQDSLYPVAELEGWKAAQVARAGSGTAISDADAKLFSGLTPQEQEAIIALARLTTRVETACSKVRDALNQVEAQRRLAIDHMQRSWGPVYEVNDDGSRVQLNNEMRLSVVEERDWQAKAHALAAPHTPALTSALDTLAEEVAVLRMMNPILGGLANVVLLTAQGAGMHVGAEAALEASLAAMRTALRELWLAANPD